MNGWHINIPFGDGTYIFFGTAIKNDSGVHLYCDHQPLYAHGTTEEEAEAYMTFSAKELLRDLHYSMRLEQAVQDKLIVKNNSKVRPLND